MTSPRIGGSFAHPLSDKLLDEYEDMIQELPTRSREKPILEELLQCCHQWYNLPESNGTKTQPHASGLGTIVDLHPDIAEELWEHIPWDDELANIQAVIDKLPTGLSETQTVEKEVTYRDLEKGETQTATIQVPAVVDKKAKALRDMAHHLLWHVVELSKDREPITRDKIGI